MAVRCVPHRELEVVFDLDRFGDRSLHLRLDCGELSGNTVLLGLEEVERYGACVVRAKELSAFGQQAVLLSGQFPVRLIHGCLTIRQLGLEIDAGSLVSGLQCPTD
ncbi:hypothetical protein [Gordonia terrae]